MLEQSLNIKLIFVTLEISISPKSTLTNAEQASNIWAIFVGVAFVSCNINKFKCVKPLHNEFKFIFPTIPVFNIPELSTPTCIEIKFPALFNSDNLFLKTLPLTSLSIPLATQ